MKLVSSKLLRFSTRWAESFIPDLISVIIPVYSEKLGGLPHVLDLTLTEHAPLDMEWIVVNNGVNPKRLVSLLAGHPLQDSLQLIHNDSNLGASWGRNRGALASLGEFLLFLDSDLLDLSQSCIAFQKNTLQNHPEIGAIGAQISKISPDRWTLYLGDHTDPEFFVNAESYVLQPDDYVNTSCIMTRRHDFKMIDGFTDYIEYMHDDVDFGFKIRQIGLSCVIDHRAYCIHPSPPPFMPQFTLWMMYKNAILFHFITASFDKLPGMFFSRLLELARLTKRPSKSTQNGAISPHKVQYPTYNSLAVLISALAFSLLRLPKLIRLRKERQWEIQGWKKLAANRRESIINALSD